MKKYIYYCNPDGDKFNWEKLKELSGLPKKIEKYKRVKVTFEKYVPLKSNSQLGYYHAGILPYLEKELFEDTGLSKDDWHNELKNRFGVKYSDKSGQFNVVKSHAKYTEKEMSFFISQVIEWVLHFFQIQIPAPLHIEKYI